MSMEIKEVKALGTVTPHVFWGRKENGSVDRDLVM